MKDLMEQVLNNPEARSVESTESIALQSASKSCQPWIPCP